MTPRTRGRPTIRSRSPARSKPVAVREGTGIFPVPTLLEREHMTDKKISRIELQKAMGDEVSNSVEKALKQFNLDPSDPDANRRAFRAVVTLAAQKLFDQGCPPQIIAQQAFEAV